MKHSILSKEEICKLFGCSMSQLNAQYSKNATQLADMRDKAKRTGNKVGNATSEELSGHAANYAKLAKRSTKYS